MKKLKKMKKLTFIWHDCFVYTDEHSISVFDFWESPVEEDMEIPSFIKEASNEKTLYIFVSHHHKDHYNKRVFEWGKLFRKVYYIVSKDVYKYSRHIFRKDSLYSGTKPNPEETVVLNEGECFTDGYMNVKAYGSTDIGNSYSVRVGSVNLFHAGDLNAWIWKDESTQEEVEDALNTYEKILDSIADDHKEFDIAMFPVDSRIGTDYFTGASMFVRRFDVKRFFPMHFCLGETEEEKKRYMRDAVAFEKYANPDRGEYISLLTPGASYAFNGSIEHIYPKEHSLH